MSNALVLQTDQIQATLDLASMHISVLDKATGHTWKTFGDGKSDLGFRLSEVSHEVSFASADIERRVLKNGAESYRVLFPALNVFVGFALSATSRDELVVTIGECPLGGRAVPMASSYPRPFMTPMNSDSYSVVPKTQGLIVPGNHDKIVRQTYDADCLGDVDERLRRYGEIFREGRSTFWWDIHDIVDQDVARFCGGLSMNYYGAKSGKSSYLCLVPTREDWQLGVEHDAGQPTRMRTYWIPSMQRLRYDRELRFRFCQNADYVALTKMYRQWIIERGEFKSLSEKAKELPHLAHAKGGVDVAIGFLLHDVRRKKYVIHRTFAQGGELVKEFKQKTGIKNAVVTVRGWQKWGHDHHYPSMLPPNSDCGGQPGLAGCAQTVRDCGYMFELAGDNYFDIAYDSPDFDEKVLVQRPDGSYNRFNMWASGMTSMLTPPWAMKFLRRNFELGKMDYPQTTGLLDMMPFDYYWIGNWGGLGNEDYNPACPLDRADYNRWVRSMLTYIRSKGKVLEMEHCSEWCVPYLDRVKICTPGLNKPNQDAEGEKQGYSPPLWGLAFRDACVTQMERLPWHRQLVLGGYPRISLPLAEDFESSGGLERLRILLKLNEVIGFDEMLSHKFLDAQYQRERCEYSSGVAVEVDPIAQTYRIEGHPGFDGKTTPWPGSGKASNVSKG
jgi:hypothetical protein